MDPSKRAHEEEEEGLSSNSVSTEAEKVEALEEEVVKLKEYINHNYSIFIKRLEKRKDKIVALSEENASLREEMTSLEGYKKQILEYRDNYEQLEEFQNQEMAKIKHMLLNSENRLQAELKEKEKLQEENERLKESLKTDNSSSSVLLGEELKDARIQDDLEESAKKSREESRDVSVLLKEKSDLEALLRDTQKNFEAYKEAHASQNENDLISILESQLSMVEHERDTIKNSLLELEIDRHDSLESEKKLLANWKLTEAKMNAERGTLEVKLSHRESEIKKLKEESRSMKESYDEKIRELEEVSEGKTYKVLSLEGQIQELKSELSKVNMDLEHKSTHSLQTANSFKRLESEAESLKENLAKKDSDLQNARETESALRAELAEHKRKFTALNKEFETCVSQIEELSSNREALEVELRTKGKSLEDNENEIVKLKRRIRDIDENLPGTIESSDLVKGLKSRISGLEEDLEDKKSVLKLQEKRMLDMKKTLQKELSRNGNSSSDLSQSSQLRGPIEGQASFVSLRDAHFLNGSRHRKNSSSSSSIDIPINDVNVQYLKRAIFKFFTGRDDEAYQMIKVISTILKFSDDESRVLHEIWEWKHSWFASKPKIRN